MFSMLIYNELRLFIKDGLNVVEQINALVER